MNIIKSTFSFLSRNGENTIKGMKIMGDTCPYKGVVIISHGMVEHIGRYENFADYLAQNGYIVYAHDHLGHKRSVNSDDELGYFAPQNGYKCVLEDLHHTARMAKQENPKLKIFLLGHSMGSFYARAFAAEYPQAIDGLIISGTGGKNKMTAVGQKIVRVLIRLKGDRYRSSFVNNMAFGEYLKKIENPVSSSDWLSRDRDVVSQYDQDKYCQFVFTLGGFKDLLDINALSNDDETFKKTVKALPIYIFSGSMDPVGDYGIGVMKVFENYKNFDCTDVTIKIYDGGRHEMLNEVNRRQVYDDVKNWLDSKTEE